MVRLETLFRALLDAPDRGISLHVCCLWIPFVSQGVDCLHSVVLRCSWTFTVIIFNDQRGSTLFASMYISFA